MANVGPTKWYLRNDGTNGWAAVTAWATGAVKAAGAVVRQNAAPTVGNERVFVCTVAGTTHATTEPTWTVTKGAATTDNTVTWQECTGQPGVNGDLTNTPTWLQNKNTVITVGLVVQRASAGSLQICSTAGTTGNGAEPAFSNVAGTTTADNTVTWTSLGAPGNFGNWAAPFARLQSAIAANWAVLTTDTIYVGADHSETQTTAMSLAFSATPATPTMVYCIPVATIPPTAVSTGAAITTTGNSTITITNTSVYFNGITFNASTGAVAGIFTTTAGNNHVRFDNCAIAKKATNATSISLLGGLTELNNTTVQFGHVTDRINYGTTRLVWRNTPSAIQGATIPTAILTPAAVGNAASILVEGVDLSALTTTLLAQATNSATDVQFVDCKTNASLTSISTAGFGPAGPNVTATRIGSSGVTYGIHKSTYAGVLSPETTIIRTGGDPTAWKVVTSASALWMTPFESLPISIRNENTTTNPTVTVYGIWGGGAVPNNDDIWMEIVYSGSSLTPMGSRATTGKASPLATATAVTSDSSTWGGSTTAFKLVSTLSAPRPAMAGYLHIYIYFSNVSSTAYIDPTPVLS